MGGPTRKMQENWKVTNQWLKNLERNTRLLEQSLSHLVLQVGDLEYHEGIPAITIGIKYRLGQFPCLPKFNPKENCHALQLRSGTAYESPNPLELSRVRREKANEQIDSELADDHSQRPAGKFHSGPLDSSSSAESNTRIEGVSLYLVK